MRAWVRALLLLVIAVCLAALSTRFGFTVDWSAGARATIAPQSQAVLAELAGPVTATSYARPGTQRTKARLLVERYRRFKPDLKLAFVDPDLDPIATQDAGIDSDGEIVLAWHGHEQKVTSLDERSFSDALVRLQRGSNQLVAFVTGDGERDAGGTGPADLGKFVSRLAARGIRALPLNLAEVAQVPRNAGLVVLASPQAALPPDSVRKLEDYVGSGGNLLWLVEPGRDHLGLGPLAQALGIRLLPGTLFDEAGIAGGLRDPRMLVATRYPSQAITDGFGINTVFPRATPLAALADAQWKVQPLLQSSTRSWSQATPPTGQPLPDHYDPATGGGLKGPLTFGYALGRLSPSPDKTQQRVVVIGDGDFLSNAYIADGGNMAFGERVFEWLLGDDALTGQPRTAPDTSLKPGRLQLALLAFGGLLVLPLLLILIGLGLHWRRRRR